MYDLDGGCRRIVWLMDSILLKTTELTVSNIVKSMSPSILFGELCEKIGKVILAKDRDLQPACSKRQRLPGHRVSKYFSA